MIAAKVLGLSIDISFQFTIDNRNPMTAMMTMIVARFSSFTVCPFF